MVGGRSRTPIRLLVTHYLREPFLQCPDPQKGCIRFLRLLPDRIRETKKDPVIVPASSVIHITPPV